jgi:tetratricopeptide (TPR) repeat protein
MAWTRGAARLLGAMAAMLALLASPAARAEWWEAQTSHFVVYSESDQGDAEKFAALLERFDNALRTLQGMPVPGPEVGAANRVKVYRTGDTDNIAVFAHASGSGVAGFYIGRAGNPVAFVPARERIATSKGIQTGPRLDIKTVLLHEYTHHFMLSNFSTAYPQWYTEGSAELYSTIRFMDDGSFHVGDVPQARGMQLDALPDIPLTRLFDTKATLNDIQRYQVYTFGWLLSHYLNFAPKRQGQLVAYLKALNSGEDSLTAAKRVFGDLDALQREVRRYKRGPFLGYDVKPGHYVEPKVAMRRLTAAEEALVRDHMRSQRGVDRKEARDVASDMAGKDATWPDSLPAQLWVGEAQIDARNWEAADAAADRALALDPESSLANLLKASAFMGRGSADKSAYAKARPYFIKARHLDELDPRPAIGYYLSFREAGEPVPEAALTALEQVYSDAAYDPRYRLILTRQLLDEGKGDLARTVIAPIAFQAHAGKEENLLLAVVKAIDDKKLDEARTKMAEIFKKMEEDSKE